LNGIGSMEKYELKELALEESAFIENLIEQCPRKDVHCHPSYVKLFEDYTKQQGFYLHYGSEKEFLLIPYFRRPIQLGASKDFSEYADLVSPWYFGGPVHNISNENALQKLFSNYMNELGQYCKKNNIVTEFQRFTPLLQNHLLYQHHPGLFYDRKIVYVDLTKDLETIYSEYTRHARKNINKATRNGLRVYSDNSQASLSQFLEIYSESMKRKNAKQYYYFNDLFFNDLFTRFKDDIKLFHVEYQGNIICSTIELGKYQILHDYLRGSNPDYFIYRPNDILVDEIIRWAKNAGYNYFVLGGGSSSSTEDPLLRFKQSFSPLEANFYVYKKIHNTEKYKELCALKGKQHSDLQFENAQFFPEYLI